MDSELPRSNVTYVSVLYNIYHGLEVSARLLKDVQVLLQQDLPLIFFVDEFYYQELSKIERSSSVKIIKWDLSQSLIYNMIMENKEILQLPQQRSVTKDTYEYMALMNSKIEFIKLAATFTKSQYIGWIDAGSSKMITDPSTSYHNLRTLKLEEGLGVVIPGCYQREVELNGLLNNVWWNYLGTFFICEGRSVEKFYHYSVQALVNFFTKGYIVWEVNVWIEIARRHPGIYTWYFADHNDSFTIIPLLLRKGGVVSALNSNLTCHPSLLSE